VPFFIDNSDLSIVYRQHQYNAEAMDGKITMINESEECYIVAHHPNKKWKYDVGWVDRKPVSEA
jgi:hypothetical protein